VERLNKEDGDRNVKDVDTHILPRKDGEEGKWGKETRGGGIILPF